MHEMTGSSTFKLQITIEDGTLLKWSGFSLRLLVLFVFPLSLGKFSSESIFGLLLWGSRVQCILGSVAAVPFLHQ